MTPAQKTELKLGIGKIPEILLDNTDRNRTSPFAFTGNKFEFRAVGSSANCSAAMIALNSAVAHQLTKFKKEVDLMIKKGRNKDEAIFQVLKKAILDSESVLFEGDNYSTEWQKEAQKRGLSSIESVPESISRYLIRQFKGSSYQIQGFSLIRNLRAVLKSNMKNSQKKSRLNQGYWLILLSIILFLPV